LPRPHSVHRYRLFNADGSEAGEANYPVSVTPGAEIIATDGRHLRVFDVMPVEEYDSP
jgi:hypothetical protein